MVKTVSTDAEAFAVYEAFFRAVESGNTPVLDLSDTGFYGSSGQALSTTEIQQENIDLSALLIAGDKGVGPANPLSVQAVRQIADALLAQVSSASGLTSQPDAHFTLAEREARAAQLSADMLAAFDAQIAANPAAATYLPSTTEERAQFNQGVQKAMNDLTDARAFAQNLIAGDTSPETIGLTVATSIRAATAVLGVLPLPPAAKAAVNIVNMATYLAPGIVALAKGDGDPAGVLTIALQMAASVLSWGISDYFFDYVAPIIISAAVDAELGANGLIDLSPTAVTQGLIEAAVHDNGGTLPDWWYTATGGSGKNETVERANVIADAYGGFGNNSSYLANLSSQIRAEYGKYGKYYQELTLDIEPNLGETRFYFAFNGIWEHRPHLSASNIIYPGVDPNTTNPWDYIHLSNGPTQINGGLYILEKDTAAFSTSDNVDTVYAPVGRPVNLKAGNDSFTFSQDALGGTGVSPYYQSVTAGLIDGGTGWDTLTTVGLTAGNPDGYTGDIVVDHNTVRYVIGPFYGSDASNFRTIATHRNFEEFNLGKLRLFDMRQSNQGIKLVTEDSFDSVSHAEIFGSNYSDTLIIDTSRLTTTYVDFYGGAIQSIRYGDFSNQNVTVDAGAGHDYVAGELINGANYIGGAGVDTFEIYAPDYGAQKPPYIDIASYIVSSLDLESGATWMRTHVTGHTGFGHLLYDIAAHTDTSATVTGFEWAVGSQYHDTIYALNSGSRIRGQDGNDTLIGRAGNDQLYGGTGDDVLNGGAGVDRLQGDDGNDTLDGGAGDDVILGGTGNDIITDLQGSNLISGGSGNDTIRTGDAANEVHAGAGDDLVTTGSGNDKINLGAGSDNMNSGAGDDVVSDVWGAAPIPPFITSRLPTRNAVLDGGEGYDVLNVDATASSKLYTDAAIFNSASFSYSFITGFREQWTQVAEYDPTTGAGSWVPVYRYQEYLNFEEIHLTGGDLTVDLVSWADFEPDFWPSIAGHAIHNAIGTGNGNDNVALGAGNDTYFAGLGNDTVAGEEDFDTLDYSRLGPDYTVDFSLLDSNGDGAIRILNSDGTLAATDTVSGFEAITGTQHDDVISLDTGDNALRGGGGNDILRGGAGNDRFLFGLNDGADTLADAAIGDVLVFEGPDGSTAPSLVRSGSAGNYTYTVTFGNTTATFSSPELLDLNAMTSSSGGATTWEMTVVDGTLVARDDSGADFNTDEDTVLTTGDVLANDTDPGAANMQIVSYDAVSANGAAVARVPGTGQFTYDPADIFDGLIDGQSAADTFTYTVSDGTTTTTATVTINVAGFTDNPVAYADSAATNEDTPVTIDALANDLDPGAKDAVVSRFDDTSTGGGTVVYNGDGTFTYTPGAGYNSLKAGETQTDTFTYTLDDGRYASTTTVTVTVTGVNDTFTANDDARVVREDQVLTIDVLANDTDPDGDPLSLSGVGKPSVGSAQIVNGKIVYTPPLNYNGPVTFTYDVTDGITTKTASVSLNYVAVDDPPVANNDTYIVTAGDWVTLDVLANDYDPEGGDLSIFTAYTPLTDIGQVAVVGNKIVYYAPLGTTGTEDIAYGIFDDAGHQAGAKATVTIIGEVAPTVTPYGYNAVEDTPYTMQAISGFRDLNGDTLSVVSIDTNVDNATVVDNGDGTFTVTPRADFAGWVHVPVVVTDGMFEVAHSQAILFRNTPDQPVLVDDVFRVRPDEVLLVSTQELHANDYDPDGQLQGFTTSVGLGVNGTISGYATESQTRNAIGSSHPGLMIGPSAILTSTSGGRVTYTPDAGFHGVSTFEYNFYDSRTITYSYGRATVYVDNDVVATDDAVTTAEDTAVIIDVLANDSDADGDAMIVHKVDQPANGIAEVLSDGTIRYTPDANFAGTETITYYVGSQYQPENAASTATITITVTPVTDPITAVDDSVTTAEDTQIVLDLTANDLNPEHFSGSILSVGTPSNGSIVQNGQTFTYIPDADFNGTDSFTYTREDGLGGTTTATVTVRVTAVNDAPIANTDNVTVAEDGSLTFDPRGNDSDPEGLALTITSVGSAAHGEAQINPDGTVTYVPVADYFGTDSFTYTVSDGDLETTATVSVTVQPTQDAPLAVADIATTQEDTAVTIDVTANDTDPDGDALTVISVSTASNGSVQFSGGQITYTPNAGYNGTEQLTYTVSDGNGGTASTTLDIRVTPVNDAPVAADDSSNGIQGATQTVDPLANDTDPDGPGLSITALNGTAVSAGQFVSLASGALVFLNSDGTVSFFPGGHYDQLTQGRSVTETVSYTVSDGAGGTGTANIHFTVNGQNDAPIARTDAATTAEDTAVTVDVLANDTDAEGDALSVVAVSTPTNGSVSFSDGQITYVPNADFNGTDQVTYTLSDGNGGTTTTTLDITVQPVNDVPVAQADTATTVEDTAVTIDVLANDTDAEGNALGIVDVSTPTNGSVSFSGGQITYVPNADFNGTDQVTYTVSDGNGGTTTATLDITVQPVNDVPVAQADTATTAEDMAVTIDVLANDTDADGEVLTMTSATDGTNGTVQIVNGKVVYTPSANFNGTDQFTYNVKDAAGHSATATVNVTVTPVEDTPIITGTTDGAVTEDGVLTASGSLLASDADPADHPVFTPQASTTGAYGTFSLTSAGEWTYLLDNQAAQELSDGEIVHETFTAVATTSDGETVSQQVTLTVTGVNDGLTAIALSAYAIDENTAAGAALADVLVSDVDVNDNHTLRLLNNAGGLFVLDGSTLRIAEGAILDYEAQTSHTVELEASDGSGNSIRQTFTVNVNDLDESFVAPDDEGSSITGDSGDNEIVGGGGDDTARSGLGNDVVTLGGGKDKVVGTAEEFNGDTITDLDEDDELILLETLLSRDAFDFSKDTGEVALDTDGDGTTDASFNLQGNFDDGDFLVFKIGSRTFASFETYLPSLEDGQALNAGHVNGIANQDFLNGDDGRSFSVKLVPVGYAGYRNTLGVYEVTPDGDIVDVRILVADATSSPRASARIENVEDGNTLGFFLLQDAGRYASGLASDAAFSFVDAQGNSANVDDGSNIWFAVDGVSSNRQALHSYSQDMNVDGLEHVLSGVNPDGTSMTIGFEDLTGGGDRDYEDLVFRLTPDDFGPFA